MMEDKRSYSPLYREYLKGSQDNQVLGLFVHREKPRKKKGEKLSFDGKRPHKKYAIRLLELNNEEVFSSGTLDRKKEPESKKNLKIEDIPAEVPVCKELRRLKSIENLPETVEIPKYPLEIDEKPAKVVREKPLDRLPVEVQSKPKLLPPPPKLKVFTMPKQNPLFKPRERPKKPENQMAHIVNDENSDKTSQESSINSLDYSIVIDYDNLQSQYNSKFLAKSGKNQDSLDLMKNLSRENLNLSIIGKKFDTAHQSFIKEKNLKVAQPQQYFLPSKRLQVKKDFKWVSLKPNIVDFSRGINKYKENHFRFTIVENTYAKIRKGSSQKLLRSLLQKV